MHFNYFKGVFPETITQHLHEDAKSFQIRLIEELKSHQLKHSNVDIMLDKASGSTLKLSNKNNNPFIRNFEKKSAYLSLNLISREKDKTELKIRIRPNSVFTILFFSHTTFGLVMLTAFLNPDNIFYDKALPMGLGFTACGPLMAVFGQISKKNLYNSFERVMNKVIHQVH